MREEPCAESRPTNEDVTKDAVSSEQSSFPGVRKTAQEHWQFLRTQYEAWRKLSVSLERRNQGPSSPIRNPRYRFGNGSSPLTDLSETLLQDRGEIQQNSNDMSPERRQFTSEFKQDKRKMFDEQFVSLDYIDVDSQWRRDEIRKLQPHDERIESQLISLFFSVLIGLITGFLAYMIIVSTEILRNAKWNSIAWFETSLIQNICFLVFWNVVLMAGSSALVVFYHPAASGAGIVEVKSYLNGIMLKDAFHYKTLIAKLPSVVLACASSPLVGPEGPIIHIGGLVGSAVSFLAVLNFDFRVGAPEIIQRSFPCLPEWRSSFCIFKKGLCQNHCLFARSCVTQGVAAGVSAAFGAPIGALLFTSEEIASFWNASLMWHTFIASLVAYIVSVQLRGNGDALFSVGSLKGFEVGDLWAVIILGLLCGLFGSTFNFLTLHVNRSWRTNYINLTKTRKFLEIIAIAVVFSCAGFLFCMMFSCRPLQATEGRAWFTSFSCADENSINPMSKLWFSSLEDQVRELFGPVGISSLDFNHAAISAAASFTYFLFFSFGVLYIAGSHMSTGIFIPLICAGASLGRCFGYCLIVINEAFGYSGRSIEPGIYAMLGASGVLAGVTHMCVAITIIMLEITYDFAYLLPIMTTIGFAKLVGVFLDESALYEMFIEMRHIPFLDEQPSLVMHKLRCEHIMRRHNIEKLERYSTVKQVFEALRNPGKDVAFPVIKHLTRSDGCARHQLVGLIQRRTLMVILNEKIFLEKDEATRDQKIKKAETRQWSSSNKVSVKDLEASLEPYKNKIVDLGKFCARSPPSLPQCATVARAFNVFRSLGLRHLVVLSPSYQVVGMITRYDLVDVQWHPQRHEQKAKLQYFRYLDKCEKYEQMRTDSTLAAMQSESSLQASGTRFDLSDLSDSKSNGHSDSKGSGVSTSGIPESSNSDTESALNRRTKTASKPGDKPK